jgi:beta-lactamase regulating signal transducer with metallopeptidase domain
VTTWTGGFRPIVIERLGWCLVHSVWQVAAITVVAALLLKCLERRSSQARYVTACLALLTMAIAPFVTFFLVGDRDENREMARRVAARARSSPASVMRADAQSIVVADPAARSSGIDAASNRDAHAKVMAHSLRADVLEPALPWLVFAWGVGVLVLSIRLLGGWMWVQWLVRRESLPVTKRLVERMERLKGRMTITRTVRLFESARAQVPLTVGWIRPVILLPVTAMTGLPSDQLEAILAHELAHVGRHDYLVNLVQSVVETLLFYHPGAWWISSRIRQERENCCDDCAVEACGDRLTYARALATLEERRSAGWLLAPSARDGSLLARVRRLLGVTATVEKPAGGLAGTLALLSVALVGFTLFVAPPASEARAGIDNENAIVGTVVTVDGKPVAEADVWLAAWAYPRTRAATLGKARTDSNGRFRLVVSNDKQTSRTLGWRVLWAHKNGLRPARLLPPDNTKALDLEWGPDVKITLDPPTPTTVRLLNSEGKPVGDGKVSVVLLNDGRSILPDELSEQLARRTDSDGKVALSAFSPESMRSVRVTHESYGTQDFYSDDQGFKTSAELKLRPVVRVQGHITADDPNAVRGVPVYLSTYPKDLPQLTGQGQSETVTDDQGRFSVPALAIGQLSIRPELPEDSLYRAIKIPDYDLSPALRTAIEVPLKRRIHVRGVVRERGTGNPIEGVGVSFRSPEEVDGRLRSVQTDGQGRYEALALPGSKSYLYLSEPRGYLKHDRGIETKIGESDGLTLDPVELERGVTLRGIVVDEAGQPVATANVDGKWQRIWSADSPDHPGLSFASTFSAAATTDAQGQFVLEGIHPGANVTLEASADQARTDRPIQAAAGTATPAKLVISGANTVSLVGRVVDAAEQPIAGALVQIRSRPLKHDGHPDPGPMRFDASVIRTDRDGRFRTPRQVGRGYGYRAEIKPGEETLMSESTPWLALKTDTRPFFQTVVLRRLRTVSGQVVDSRRKPVAMATVRQAGDGPAPTETVTDRDGRFILHGVLAAPAFVFVVKDGYRFEGKPIRADESSLEIVLTRPEETFTKPVAAATPPLVRADELAILHRVFDAYAERVIKEGGASDLFAVLRILIWVDPGKTAELLNDPRLEPWQPNNLRLSLAVQLARENEQEARTLIEAISDANMRSYAYSEASAALPVTRMALKLELLNESLIAGRAVTDAESRVLRLADIGGRLFDLGKTAEATNLVREAQTTAVKLRADGTAAWARGRLAEELAQVDLPAALNLLEVTKEDRQHDSYLGRIAHELAAKNPGAAERVLMMIRDVWPNFRDEFAERVCYRMVAADPERAKALAAAMKKPRHRARALGAMASALTRTKGDRASAIRLLDEAFAVLEQAVASGTDDWDGLGMACTAGAGLLPIVEQVDARLIPEYLMRTLALRPPIPGPRGRDGIADIANSLLAALISRYDRAIARQILDGFADGAVRRRVGLDDWGSMFHGDRTIEAMALVDPARAVAMLDSLPATASLSTSALKNACRLAIAQILAQPEDERRRYVERNMLHLWRIDSEEDED